MEITLDHVENANAAGNAKTFWFKSPQAMRYIAGQYIEMHLPHDNPDDRGEKRWFTLSSSPTNELISITTKHAAERSSTFKEKLFSLQPGDKVNIVEPMGDFVLPKDPTIPLVFVAAGIGVTPMHSMIQWLHDQHEERDITLLYAARNHDEMAFEELFRSTPGVHLVPLFDTPPEGWTGLNGPLTAELIVQQIDPAKEPLIYVSGPEPLVEALEKDLHALGVKPERLVLDFFPGYRN